MTCEPHSRRAAHTEPRLTGRDRNSWPHMQAALADLAEYEQQFDAATARLRAEVRRFGRGDYGGLAWDGDYTTAVADLAKARANLDAVTSGIFSAAVHAYASGR